jgi:hypothetical protein
MRADEASGTFLVLRTIPRLIDSQTPRCLSALRAHCEDTFDLIDCQAAYHWCTRELFFPLFAIGAPPFRPAPILRVLKAL